MELVESKMEYCETSDDGAGKTNYDHHMVDDHDEDYKKQSADDHDEDEQDVPLPGFRFHPTDEELVGFYLRRKVEKRPISIELIKQIDIYKYDPWDLPKGSNVGDKEWYFFCKRGRKYRNSIRPNRVTGSGFWKATGIDRPIYGGGEGGGPCGTRGDCIIIGLKKSLVYYRGSAGKGTKTDWMMHEFRLPPPDNKSHYKLQHPTTNIDRNDKSSAQEAEVWTLCRILKRNVSSYKKCIPDWREVAAAKRSNTNPVISAGDQVSSSGDSSDHNTHDLKQGYNISFQNPPLLAGQNDKKKSFAQHHDLFHPHHHQHHVTNGYSAATIIASNQQQFLTAGHDHIQSTSSPVLADPSSTAASYSSYPNLDINEFSKHGDWNDLRSVVEFAVTDPIYFMQ